jgi:hypothetical protein
MPDYETLFVWLVGLSIIMFLGSLILLPIVIIRLPTDYFIRDHKKPVPNRPLRSLLWRVMLRLLKNLLGGLMLLAGLLMLITPGQGIIAILVALMLLDIPGKVRLKKALLARPAAHAAINKIRRLTGCEPLQMPPTSSAAAAKKAPPDPLDKNGSH